MSLTAEKINKIKKINNFSVIKVRMVNPQGYIEGEDDDSDDEK